MTVELTIEIAPFTVRDETAVPRLMEASDRLERDFLSRMDGYLGRVLVQRSSTEWADIVFWRSEQHAAQAMQAAATSEACRSYFECMQGADHDNPDQGVTLYRSRKHYGSIAF